MQFDTDGVIYTFYVGDDEHVTIVCPACRLEREVDAAKYRNSNAELTVRCKCGQAFKAHLEFRRYYRKKVKLPGEYVNLTGGDKGEVLIEDLSMNGAGFSCTLPHDIKEGDVIDVSFRLDTPLRHAISRKCKVTRVRDMFVHCQFKDEKRDHDLGFYLMP